MTIGRVDVHSHLLPALDDGCQTPAESIECARILVTAGYTHCFCTPHTLPSEPEMIDETLQTMKVLQAELDRLQIPLKLLPGGEISLRPDIESAPPESIVTYNLARKHVLVDLWTDLLPDHFDRAIRRLQSLGLTVILAHPERMRAVQDNPSLVDHFDRLGLLLQGNLQCLSDPPGKSTRKIAELLLTQNRYFMLATDLHALQTLPARLNGLSHAITLVGESVVDKLTKENPRRLLLD